MHLSNPMHVNAIEADRTEIVLIEGEVGDQVMEKQCVHLTCVECSVQGVFETSLVYLHTFLF